MAHIEELECVAKLAGLKVSDEEAVQLTQDLENILSFASAICEIDVGNAASATSASVTGNVLREDVPGMSLKREDVLAQAPSACDDGFTVPLVME